MRRIAVKEGDPTDMSHDHELTDWHVVEWFARRAAALVQPVHRKGPVVAPPTSAEWGRTHAELDDREIARV
jgi:hypothetical protein